VAVYNKVFFHGIGTGIGQMANALTTRGIPMTVKSVANGGWAASVAQMRKDSGVRHNIIYRDPEPGSHPNDHPNYDLPPDHAAEDHWNLVKSVLPPEVIEHKDVIWIEPVNEIDTEVWGDWLGRFCFEMGKLAIRDGYKVLLSGFNAGQPEENQWSLNFRDFLSLCADNPDSVGVSLHEGKLGVPMDTHPSHPLINPWLIGRWQFLHDWCDAMSIARPTIFISEWSWSYNDMPSEEIARRDIAWVSESVAAHPNIRGVLLWNLDVHPNWGDLPGKLVKLMPWLTQFTIDTRYYDVPQADSPFFYSPVGANLAERSRVDFPYPLDWENVNGYKRLYTNSSTGNQSYHTGSDLNLNVPSFDTDRGMGVFPSASGKVIHVGQYPVWGGIIVVEHNYQGSKVYTRYGHLHKIAVSIGQCVGVEDKLGVIGNDALDGPYHLHFDISETDVLLNDPADWPGMDIERVEADYVDPDLYLLATRSPEGQVTVPNKIKHTIHLFPQDTTLAELVDTVTILHRTRSAFTYSHDAAHAIMYAGNPDSLVVLWEPQRWNMDIISYFANMGVRFEVRKFFSGAPVPPIPPAPTPGKIDMAKYFIPKDGLANGHIVTLANSWGGGNERQQLQRTSHGDLLTKNSQYEKRVIGADYIDLVLDTSPGDGEYYTSTGHWIPRYWAPGESYISDAKEIVFRRQSDCTVVPGKTYLQPPTTLRFAQRYPSYAVIPGVVFYDVVKLEWVINGNVDETYYFAEGMGLVKWEKYDGRESHAVEIIQPDDQDPNIPNIISCA